MNLVGGHAADEGDGRLDDLALGDGALEVAHHGVTEAAQHLGRLVALLLRVDHVRLGEHAAAAGDAGRLAGIEDDVPHVFDLVEQAAGLLVHEGAGTGGAVAVGLVVDDTGAARLVALFQTDELGRLAAHLEDRARLGVEGADAARDRLELVLEAGGEGLANEPPAGARHPHAVDLAIGQHRDQLVEQRLRGLARTALDAPVARHEHGPAVDHGEPVGGRLEESGMSGEDFGVEGEVFSLSGQRRFEADAADVDTE
jgi:hypothetical protein